MTYSALILAASSVPSTVSWSPKIAIIMILCNVLAIAIGKYGINHPSKPPALPSAELFGGMGFPALLATTSLGHIIGAGVILGLAYTGGL
ncbi:photosystem I reaction center subunit PsaK [Lusitaniella coriacea LEGE 07157]|uniref:Photosystem I reaction center subunit PsaK n=1 Tax=Lusitaniella coriacea LEGE 07157 TaxID=945747 RepID=A0A8J7JAU5_9CYAN|nr:photosystem I reaction center subunit PsaK [Lusitaniella coriacea]MBE9116490.1 photosystem I reaction center subunit PsaK [Lusitaniella coriacea LEGE 07157]